MGFVMLSAKSNGHRSNGACAAKVNSRTLTCKTLAFLCGVAVASGLVGCGAAPESNKEDSVELGVLLPFTGREAALGRNIEQAMLLAVEDVNAAGGLDGKPFSLVTRDSHSGTDRGLDQLVELLYTDDVQYLIGPEENELANEIVRDVKSLDIFNMLPGYAAPNVERISSKGAWMRLAPTTYQTACGMAQFAVEQGADTLNSLASTEDYNLSLSNEVGAQFEHYGGEALDSVTVDPESHSFKRALQDTFGDKPDRTVLIASPATASALVTEWAVQGGRGHWYLSPLLRAEAFLSNVPFGSLDGAYGLSPSLSLASECKGLDGEQGRVECSRANADRFAKHFEERWDGDRPLSASRLYYDAVVLMAMGMRYGLALDGEVPAPQRLHELILELNTEGNDEAQWYSLKKAMNALDDGKKVRFVGVAEYSFDRYGAAQHTVYDLWKVKDQRFVDSGTFFAHCTVHQ